MSCTIYVITERQNEVTCGTVLLNEELLFRRREWPEKHPEAFPCSSSLKATTLLPCPQRQGFTRNSQNGHPQFQEHPSSQRRHPYILTPVIFFYMKFTLTCCCFSCNRSLQDVRIYGPHLFIQIEFSYQGQNCLHCNPSSVPLNIPLLLTWRSLRVV